MFYGIIIRMYTGKGEHNPPHFHAYYQDSSALIDIEKCEIFDGKLSQKQSRLVLAWTELHKDELLADWEIASKGETPFKIDPLK